MGEAFLLGLICGFFNAVMDVIKHRWERSVFSEIDNKKLFLFFHQDGWKNKYVDETFTTRRNVPVTFTDGWHLAKSFLLTTVTISIILIGSQNIYDTIFFALIWRVCFGFSFSYFYNVGLIK